MTARTTLTVRAGALVTGGVAFMVAGIIDIAVAGGRMFMSRRRRTTADSGEA